MRWRCGYVIWGLVLLIAVGCGGQAMPTPEARATVVPATAVPPTKMPMPTPTALPITAVTNPNWWDDAVFYEIFVRSFADSDGDGVGDLNGLIANLDYLNDGNPNTHDDLGVTGIWLMPIMQSPSYHGYDVVDYYQIDEEYGSNEDFLRLMTEAQARGIHIIVDLVMNHTSDQHPWFLEAQEPDSTRRDWYVWADEPGDRWHDSGEGYYYGYFWSGMPDLNFENPAVTAAMQDVIRFWLEDMGVAGFRLDAIKHLLEDGRILENTPANHTWLAQEFYPVYKTANPQALAVGEVWSTTDDIIPYVGDEVDLAFEFSLADAALRSAQSERKVHIERALSTVVAAYPPGQYATFLANHDQNRTRSVLLSDEQAKIAATLQLLSPGVPFIYYGEEIGMQGEKPDENIRRPMQWDDTGGFSTAVPWHPYFEDYQERHVAGQNDDPNSLLSHYRRLIQARSQNEALRYGDWQLMPIDDDALYAFMRRTVDQTLLVLVNLGDEPITDYHFAWPDGGLNEETAVEILQNTATNSPALTASGGFESYTPIEELAPYSTYIVELK